MPRARGASRIVALMSLLVVALLLALELWLRATTSRVVERGKSSHLLQLTGQTGAFTRQTVRGNRLVPGSHVTIEHETLSGGQVAIDVDALGFRGPEIPKAKPAGEVRILALGDSITLAAYLPEPSCWVRRLEDHLRAGEPGKPITVVNAGVSDVGLVEEVDVLEESGLSIDPDVVVLAFYLNDSRPPWGFTGELGSRGWLRRTSVLADTIYRQMKLRKWVKAQGENRFAWIPAQNGVDWRHDRAAFAKLATMARYDWGAAWEPSSWRVIDRQLDRLGRDTSGREVIVVALPAKFQVYADFLEDGPQRTMEAKVKERGWPYVDMLPAFRARRDLDPDLFFDHCHPRAAGNDLIATEVAKAAAPVLARIGKP